MSYIAEEQSKRSIPDTSPATLERIGWLKMCKECPVKQRQHDEECCQ